MAIDVSDWLHGLGLGQYAGAFSDNDIDGDILSDLTADDLIGLGVSSIGHRRKLLAAIAALRDAPTRDSGPVSPPPAEAAESTGAERRLLTIMFCDVVGSTELATRLDPEDLREVIGTYHSCVTKVLTRFGGFVAKYMGDGILAYFGYPQAHEEDAEQAVRAGLAIVDAVGRLNLPVKLELRLGIATGLVVVGDLLGTGAAQEQSVIGETPNLAARLQNLAEPNAIIIAEATRRHIGGLFELNDLGVQELKGFAGAMQAWQVLGESGIASRFEALRSRETPLIGRDEELELLLRRWDQAKSAEGRVVLIWAEPGIGKSRLIEAVEERIGAEPHRRLRYFCSPHHQDSALYPIIGQLERAAGFVRGDDPPAQLQKLTAMLAAGDPAPDDLALFADLLSVPGTENTQLTPQQKKERTFEALLRSLEGLAGQSPVLMVFEDIHWMDPTSLELLDRTIARVERLPVLLIATFRPEFQSSWVGQSHVTMLALSRLGRREGAALVQRLAGNLTGLADDIVNEIIERTDGVPLFLEEVTKAILETAEAATSAAARGAISSIPAARGAVPATLQASLMARLDRLGPAAREIAQTGAAIGRDFSYELVTAVATRSEAETRAALDQLVSAGLVFQRGTPPTAEYQFKHALVQDTAYGTLLRGPRQALHGRIAAAIEAHASDRVERQPELLAHHLADSAQSERAALYWRKAGQMAVRRAANREAIGHFRRALAMIETQPEAAERWRAELAILSQMGPPAMAVYGWSASEVGEIVERAATVGRQLESSPEIAPAIANLWIFNMGRGRIDRCEEISADLFRMAGDLGDPEILLQAHHCGWATRFAQGRFEQTAQHLAAGAALYDEQRHAHHRHVYLGHDPRVCCLNFGASLACALGHFDNAQRMALDGIDIARRLDHAPTLANALWHSCEMFVMRGDPGAVLGNARDLIDLTDVHGLPVPRGWGMSYFGWALVQSGEITDGLAQFDKGRDILSQVGAQLHATLIMTLHAESLIAAGRLGDALAQAEEALATAERSGERSFLPRLHGTRAAVLRQLIGPAESAVEKDLEQALAMARQQQAMGWELFAAIDLARHWAELGRRDAARSLLAPVYSRFTEGFDARPLREAMALIDELS